jgi:hypothetical protein
VGAGGASGRLDVGVAGVRPAVGDVVTNRLGEEEALLEGHADLAAQRVEADIPHVVAVDEDGALLWVEKAGHELDCGRLAAPARPDDGDALPGIDMEVEVT